MMRMKCLTCGAPVEFRGDTAKCAYCGAVTGRSEALQTGFEKAWLALRKRYPEKYGSEPLRKGPEPFGDRDDIGVINACLPSVFEIMAGDDKTTKSRGTCFLADNGYLVTNAHCVSYTPGSGGAARAYGEIKCRQAEELENSKLYRLEIVGYDSGEDIAVLRFQSARPDAPGLRLSETPAEMGQPCFTIGNGKGYGLTVSTGVIGRKAALSPFSNVLAGKPVLQASFSLNEGNSGGPLFSQSGGILGMTTAVPVENGKRAAGMSFAIPAESIQNYLKALKI